MRGKKVLLSMCLFSVGAQLMAQRHAGAEEFFRGMTECASTIGGWRCLELDLSAELTEENDTTKSYQYSWNFGDGHRQPGHKIEHCYEDFGSYQISMDLIDTEADVVIRNELSATLDLFPEIRPSIGSRRDNLPPSFVELYAAFNEEVFVPDQVYWRIDQAFYEGEVVRHSFPVAGVYLIEMGVIKESALLGTMIACVHTEITITESDLWSGGIRDFLGNAHRSVGSGPFATDEVVCVFQRVDNPAEVLITPVATMMGKVSIKPDQTYDVWLVSGRIFTKRKRVVTHHLDGNELYLALKDTLSSFVGEQVLALPAVRMAMNQVEVSPNAQDLLAVRDFLLAHPEIFVEVGAYVHSGSRLSKGTAIAKQRAHNVKEALTRMGIDENRINVASPEHDGELVNTCGAEPDCREEDLALNGKVEFRITRIGL